MELYFVMHRWSAQYSPDAVVLGVYATRAAAEAARAVVVRNLRDTATATDHDRVSVGVAELHTESEIDRVPRFVWFLESWDREHGRRILAETMYCRLQDARQAARLAGDGLSIVHERVEGER